MAIAPAALERLPPSNVDAEQAVIGSLLLDRDALVKVSAWLQADDFFRESHRFVYQAMLDLYKKNEPCDIVTVTDELERRGQLAGVGGVAYIHSLATVVPTAIHVEYYGRIVQRTSLKRRLISVAGRMASIGYDDALEVDDAFSQSEQMLLELIQRRVEHDFVPIDDVLSDYFENLEEILRNAGKLTGLPSGFSELDNKLGGFQKSDLIVLAARPGIGKTAFILNLADNIARETGKGVAIFNLEMSAEQLVQRMVACRAGVNLQHLRTGALPDWEHSRVVDAISSMSGLPIYFDESGDVSITELRSKARRLQAEHGISMIMVDYLQLMRGSANRSRDNRVQEISEITRQLKQMARELEIPVLAVSQLSRAIEGRGGDPEPKLSDLRDSGSIEQDADIVMFISRDRNSEEQQNLAKIIIEKHRNGPTGHVDLQFFGAYQQFADLPMRAAPQDY
ncbi:MAG TPA: replicative DNA helicase [Chloroflexota bacterium]|nr:replicative DNA helicase [Chloroflexota bacterium]